MSRTILLLILLFTSKLYGGTISPNVSDQKYIDHAKKFNYIVKIHLTDSSNQLMCASAIIIDDNHALTAAHVVKPAKMSKLIFDNDEEFIIDKIIIHKDFEELNFGQYDIALCYSKKSFNLLNYPILYENKDEIDKQCEIVGYGLTGNFSKGVTTGDSEKRAGTNTIDYIFKDLLVCTPSKFGEKNFTEREFIIAHGDSGGGLFIDGKLAGINSCVMATDGKPDSTFTDESGHTRISVFSKWIKDNKIK